VQSNLKTNKMKKLKGIDGKLDLLWSRLVKLQAEGKCEVCGVERPLNSHHIFSRSNRSVRWDEANGVSLCVSHHTFNSKFSAHKTPTEFTYWLENEYGREFLEELRYKANQIKKWTKHEKEELLEQLEEKIKKYEK
jgi:hypothetical protein